MNRKYIVLLKVLQCYINASRLLAPWEAVAFITLQRLHCSFNHKTIPAYGTKLNSKFKKVFLLLIQEKALLSIGNYRNLRIILSQPTDFESYNIHTL